MATTAPQAKVGAQSVQPVPIASKDQQLLLYAMLVLSVKLDSRAVMTVQLDITACKVHQYLPLVLKVHTVN